MRRMFSFSVSSVGVRSLFLGVVASVALGCGGSGNDQGTSFTLYNIAPASVDVPLSTTDGDGTTTGAIRGVYSLQNNIARQGVRVQRIRLSFYVEGSDVQPPDTTVAAGGIMGPTQPDGEGGSLPPGFNQPPSLDISSFVVPPEIMTWLNLNRASLPEPPYSLTVDATVNAVTTAGDNLDSNNLATVIAILPDVVIEPEAPAEGEDPFV